jgi:hypothetical protein
MRGITYSGGMFCHYASQSGFFEGILKKDKFVVLLIMDNHYYWTVMLKKMSEK